MIIISLLYMKILIYILIKINCLLGKFIIGESPHQFNPEKYQSNEQIIINGELQIYINEIKLKSPKSNYKENDIKVFIQFNSNFIQASLEYKKEIESYFFSNLIKRKLCKKELIRENIKMVSYFIYSCVNNENMISKIKNFPSLYFEIKTYNLTFLFTYKELFQLHNDRLYFLIIFRNTTYITWNLGEIFLRKYTPSFNYDSKTISFYKTVVDEINVKTDVPYTSYDDSSDTEPIDDDSDKEIDKDSDMYKDSDIITDDTTDKSDNNPKEQNNKKEKDNVWKIVRIIIEVLMGVIIIVFAIVFVIKFSKIRKKRANELKDDNYEYVPEGPLTSENNS